MSGYIYVRSHKAYENYCKLGITNNLKARDRQYATGEIVRGVFTHVFEVNIDEMKKIEKILHNEFKQYHMIQNGGCEFYDQKIIKLIEPCFLSSRIKFKRLDSDEISTLIGIHEIIKPIKKSLFCCFC